jgi:ribonuclease P protein component
MTARAYTLGRLKMRSEFERVAAEGKRHRSIHLGLIYLHNGLHETRVGIGVPERTSKSAVRRNRIKRILRERLRALSKAIIPGFDIVITALSDPGSSEGAILSLELKDLLIKSGLLQEEG